VNRKKMQQEDEASSMDPWAIFLYGMKGPMTSLLCLLIRSCTSFIPNKQ
jgi:hypothetical protein